MTTAVSPLPDLTRSAGCIIGQERHRLDCLVRHLLAGDAGGTAYPRGQADAPAGDRHGRPQAEQPAADPSQVVPPAPPGEPAPWSRAVALGLDPTAEQLVIQAGIGWLRITPTTVDWRPVQPRSAPPPPPPSPAPEPLRLARLATCQACSRYIADRCQVAGCGCAGLGNPAAQFSKCPLGRWEP